MEYSPTEFDNWIQVVALLIIVLGVVATKYLNTIKKDAVATQETANKVLDTLTTNNGGGNIKDQLDRVEGILTDHIKWSEGYVSEQDARISALEEPGCPADEVLPGTGENLATEPTESAESPQES